MFTVIDSAFDSTILTHPGIYLPAAQPRARATRATRANRVAAIAPAVLRTPEALWRCTLAEDVESQTHGACVRMFCAVAGLLSVGSIGYAGWRVLALLGDDRLHDAVAAFAH